MVHHLWPWLGTGQENPPTRFGVPSILISCRVPKSKVLANGVLLRKTKKNISFIFTVRQCKVIIRICISDDQVSVFPYVFVRSLA